MTNARVFGSVARGEEGPSSDLDLLVDFPPRTGLLAMARMQAELESLLGVEVDLVPDAGLKPAIRATVEQDLVPL
ncbi:MAG: nucleotidyltransferase family protein [Propioniciclava sp.]|uniref:nucleotidyltransferase family protein n=1 Tax=Propioniciclava sp. TaxID=2038686 RepID=UPI0039E3F3A9